MRQFLAQATNFDRINSVSALNNRNFSFRILALAAAALLSVATMSQASGLGVGQTLYPAPGEAEPGQGATIACGPLVQPFVTATFSGVLTSTVYANDATNPFGGLTFTYLVANDASSVNVNARLSVNGYTGFLTDASYSLPLSGVRPTYADRPSADVVGFSFLGAPVGFGPIQPGQSSALLIIQTNASTCVNSFASVIDGTVATIATYAPAPEPSTLALMGIGALALIRRRR